MFSTERVRPTGPILIQERRGDWGVMGLELFLLLLPPVCPFPLLLPSSTCSLGLLMLCCFGVSASDFGSWSKVDRGQGTFMMICLSQ